MIPPKFGKNKIEIHDFLSHNVWVYSEEHFHALKFRLCLKSAKKDN